MMELAITVTEKTELAVSVYDIMELVVTQLLT
jgi:hypothetical protein